MKTIRTPSKPSTAKCDLDTYTLFLLAEPKYAGCNRLSEILGDVSHDSINRFLLRERYEPKDLFDEIKQHIDLIDGTLSGDDTVIDKPYSDPALTELIGYFWSGKHHRVVKGIQLITLYYTDPSGQSVPVNYRIYDKQEGKSKNDYFREMIEEVIAWGLKPKTVTGDTWYSSQENLKFLRNQKLGFLMGIAKNRKVSVQPGLYAQVQELPIPDNGLVVHSREFWECKSISENVQKRGREVLYYVPPLPGRTRTFNSL